MFINFNNREIELKFGLRTLTEIDRELGFEVEGARLGQGIEMLVPKLESGNIIGLAKVIKAATSHDKHAPKTYDDLELVLDNIAESIGYEKFGQQVIEELGKRPMTRGLLPEELRPEKKEKTKKA